MNQIKEFIRYVNKLNIGSTCQNTTFKDITTLKIGGKIACVFEPYTLDGLVIAFKYIKEKGIKYLVIGNGSNILASDEEHQKVVILLKNLNRIVKLSNNTLLVSAGIKTMKLASVLTEMGYTGHEFLGVIPATLGGAVYMNASCYHQSINDIVKEVIYLNEDGTISSYMANELDFKYRKSVFQELKGIIIFCVLQLKLEEDKDVSKTLIKKFRQNKNSSQPTKFYTAGSAFKNPKEQKAWEIIDKLGYRGFKYKDIIISEKHTNFICNQKNATFIDMIYILNKIKQEAKEKFDVNLEYEWEIID